MISIVLLYLDCRSFLIAHFLLRDLLHSLIVKRTHVSLASFCKFKYDLFLPVYFIVSSIDHLSKKKLMIQFTDALFLTNVFFTSLLIYSKL